MKDEVVVIVVVVVVRLLGWEEDRNRLDVEMIAAAVDEIGIVDRATVHRAKGVVAVVDTEEVDRPHPPIRPQLDLLALPLLRLLRPSALEDQRDLMNLRRLIHGNDRIGAA